MGLPRRPTVSSVLAGALIAGCGPATAPIAPPTPPPTAARLEPEVSPRFEVMAGCGIDFAYRNGEEVTPPHLAILESLGGGGAALDFDGDGLTDLYLVGGGHFGGSDNKQILGYPGRLYRNLGDFKFQDVTDAAGLGTLAGGQPWFYSHGAAVGDYDRDGWPDLLVTGYGRIALLHNEPDGTGGRRFVDVSESAGLSDGVTWATSAAWADLDADGWSDLFVCQYVNWSFDNHPNCSYDGKTPDVCPPKQFAGLTDKVFRNTGGGRFDDASGEVGLAKGGMSADKGLGVVVVDLNGDGKPDVYVANDTVPNSLYINQSEPGRIRFVEQGMPTGVAMDGNGVPNGSMGLDAGDPYGTGVPSMWVTNYEKELHGLYRNLSKPSQALFLYDTPASGIAALGQKFVGWGTGFADFDLDGWEDLFIANGHAIRYPTTATRLQRPVLLKNRGGGKFADVSARGGDYFAHEYLSRGVVYADFDNDGRTDIAVCHMNAPASVLRNVTTQTNRWLGVALVGDRYRDAVGAKVTAEVGGRTQSRFAKGGGSYLSSPERRFVFGLGTAEKVDKLAVVWPDGTRQEWIDVPPGRYYTALQGVPELKPTPTATGQ